MYEIEWWAYIHVNDTLHVKRYFNLDDIIEAQSSSFVKKVYGPVPLGSRESACIYFSSKAKEDGFQLPDAA